MSDGTLREVYEELRSAYEEQSTVNAVTVDMSRQTQSLSIQPLLTQIQQ